MSGVVSFNNRFVTNDDIPILATSSAALYGKGIFTTIAVYEGKAFFWDKHWRRLETNAEKLKIDLTWYSQNTTKDSLDELISKNKVNRGRARITLFDESPTAIWPFETNQKTSLLITTGNLRPAIANFRLTISPYPINSRAPLTGVKSCNYLENLLAIDEAKARGFDEAIRVNERGEVTSGAMSNVFWLKNEMLNTPSLRTGCLGGTTREFVIENIDCLEVEASLDELRTAEAIFLTSAGLGVIQAAEFESRRFNLTDHPITRLLPSAR